MHDDNTITTLNLPATLESNSHEPQKMAMIKSEKHEAGLPCAGREMDESSIHSNKAQMSITFTVFTGQSKQTM